MTPVITVVVLVLLLSPAPTAATTTRRQVFSFFESESAGNIESHESGLIKLCGSQAFNEAWELACNRRKRHGLCNSVD